MKQRIFLWLTVLVVAVIFTAVTAYSGTVSLPKTGQTTTYAVSGGDDGDLQAGVDWPSPRFTVDGTGDCMIDGLTGLMWTKNANLAPGQTWDQALVYANTLNLCNQTDWRLPNVNELESLIHYGAANPVQWLIDQGFTGVQAAPYWASTTYFRYSPPQGKYKAKDAWVVDISKGGALTGGFYQNIAVAGIPIKTATTPYVWSVRGGVID